MVFLINTMNKFFLIKFNFNDYFHTMYSFMQNQNCQVENVKNFFFMYKKLHSHFVKNVFVKNSLNSVISKPYLKPYIKFQLSTL